jgi:hypothetical protein
MSSVNDTMNWVKAPRSHGVCEKYAVQMFKKPQVTLYQIRDTRTVIMQREKKQLDQTSLRAHSIPFPKHNLGHTFENICLHIYSFLPCKSVISYVLWFKCVSSERLLSANPFFILKFYVIAYNPCDIIRFRINTETMNQTTLQASLQRGWTKSTSAHENRTHKL